MFVRRAFCFLVLMVPVLACGSPSVAQVEAADSKANDRLREQTIYVPYDKLRETFEKEGRGVFLPYEKFQELWQAARAKQLRPTEVTPPVNALITEIDNEALVQRDVVQVTARVKIDLLGKGWIQVPLRLSDTAVLSATINDQPARLVTVGTEKSLLLKKDHDEVEQIQVRLEYARSISKAPGQNSVTFQPPLAPVNRWRIRVPESGVKVNVHPMLAATEIQRGAGAPGTGGNDAEPESGSAGPEEDETVVMAFVGAAPTVRIDWTPKAEGARGLDALVSVRTEQQVTIDEGITRTQARLFYQISRAELSELTIELPADQRVVNVVDANVRQWDVTQQDQTQRITIGLFEPARDQQTLTVELEKFADHSSGAPLSVAAIKAVNVGRQRGIIVIRLADSLRAEAARRAGLLQLDASEMPQHLSGQPWVFSYRYAALPFELLLQVEKIKPQIQVDQLVEVFLQPRQLTLDLFAKYDIQRAGVFELDLDVPPGYDVRHVRGHGAAGAQAAAVDSFVLEGENKTRLKVNLSSKAMGSVGLMVELEMRLQDANLLSPTGESSVLAVTPPRVASASVQRATGRLVVYSPESLRIGLGELQGVRNISFNEAFQDMASVRNGRFPELRPVQAFAFSEGSASVSLTAQRRQPNVTARQLLVVRIDPGVIRYEATFFYDIRYSSIKGLRIDVPTELAGRIRNETPTLREKTLDPAPDDLAADYTAWSITGETELIGQTQCKLTWETPIEQLGVGTSVDLAVPRLIPRAVDRADGQIVLAKAETIDVQPQEQSTGLDPIDPQRDLMSGASVPDAAAALEFHDDWTLQLTATRYQLEVLKHTSIEQAVLRMVLTRSQRVSVQALYRMRSSRQRLEIQLPDDVAPDHIEFDTDPLRINGRRVTLERGADKQTFFVPLVGQDTNRPFLLELRYTAPGGGERLEYPIFPDEPAVQKVDLVAYVPQEWACIGSRGPWTDETLWTYDRFLRHAPTMPVNAEGLIRQLMQGINVSGDPAKDFPVDGRPFAFSTLRPPDPSQGALQMSIVDRRMLYGIVFGVVALAGVVLIRRPAGDRIVVVCGIAAALLLLAAFLPTLAYAIFSLVLVLAILLVALLWLAVFATQILPKLGQMRWRRRLPSETESVPKTSTPAQASDPEPPIEATPVPEPPSPGDASSTPPTDQEGGQGHA